MPSAIRIDKPGRIKLKTVRCDAPARLDRERVEADTRRLGEELSELEDLLFYAGRHSLLVVLQGRDTSGKDGTIRLISGYCTAQSCRVESFKVPTPLELAHDFLWRVHAKVPARGELVLFNRSQYEDVLVVRVHDLVPRTVWQGRYESIRHFESLLAASGCLVLKFYLHISEHEQEKRLLEREADQEKAWKLAVGDWKERQFWRAYTAAYEDAIGKCAARHAPWFIVPADEKWYRNYLVLEAIVASLRPYKTEWLADLQKLGKKRRAEIDEYRRARRART